MAIYDSPSNFGNPITKFKGIDLSEGATINGDLNILGNIILDVSGVIIGTLVDQKIGFLNATPTTQPSGSTQVSLGDNTGGTPASNLIDVSTLGLANVSKINDNFATLLQLVLALRTALVNLGLIKGSA